MEDISKRSKLKMLISLQMCMVVIKIRIQCLGRKETQRSDFQELCKLLYSLISALQKHPFLGLHRKYYSVNLDLYIKEICLSVCLKHSFASTPLIRWCEKDQTLLFIISILKKTQEIQAVKPIKTKEHIIYLQPFHLSLLAGSTFYY